MVGAARKRGDPLNHILFSGPPGLGKTTLAFILGNELGRNVRVTSGPVIEKAGDLAGLLTNLEEGDILFIDEIHRIPKTVEEYLYSAMEDFRIDIMIDQGPNARSVRLSLPRFTLVGATTRSGLLTRAAALEVHPPDPPRLLRQADPPHDRRAGRAGFSRSGSTTGGASEIASAGPGHAPGGQQPHQLRPGLRPGARERASSRARWPRPGSSCSRSTRPVWTRWTSGCSGRWPRTTGAGPSA